MKDPFMSFVCVRLPLIIFMIIVAILGARYRMRNAQRLSRLLAEGEYDHWREGKTANRVRLMSILGLIVGLGVITILFLLLFAPSILSPQVLKGAGLIMIVLTIIVSLIRRTLTPRL